MKIEENIFNLKINFDNLVNLEELTLGDYTIDPNIDFKKFTKLKTLEFNGHFEQQIQKKDLLNCDNVKILKWPSFYKYEIF